MALDRLLLPVITDCRKTITSFRDEIVEKYGETLGEDAGSRLSFGKAKEMLRWHVRQSVSVPLVANTLDIRDRLIVLYQEMQAMTKLVAGLQPNSQQCVVLEDAHGYPLRLSLEIVMSWNVRIRRMRFVSVWT